MVARTQVILIMTLMILHVLPQLFHFARFPFMSGKVPLLRVFGLQEGCRSVSGRRLGAQAGSKTAEDGPKTGQDASKTAQDGSKTAEAASKTAPRRPKMRPRVPQRVPGSRLGLQEDSQEGSKDAKIIDFPCVFEEFSNSRFLGA